MSVKRPPVICPYLEIMEQHKQYQQHAKRISSARSCVDSKQPTSPRQFSYYLSKYKDSDKKTRLKKPNQIKSARGTASRKKLSETDNWMTQLNDVVLPRQCATKVSPSAVLLFPSPVVPNSRTPETLRQIIDDSGLKVLDESPLSARDSYYAKDIQSLMIKPPGPAFNVKPSPRPRSMRKQETQEMKVSRPSISQSERQQRPTLQFEQKFEEEDAIAKKKIEEQRKKFDEINLDDYKTDNFNVSLEKDRKPSNNNTNKDKKDFDPLGDIDSFLNNGKGSNSALSNSYSNEENRINSNTDDNYDSNLDDKNEFDLKDFDRIVKDDTDVNYEEDDDTDVNMDEIDNILNNDVIKQLGNNDSGNIEIDINDNNNEFKEVVQPSSPKRETIVKFQLPEFANDNQ